jgi:hypothetical protein
MSTKDNLLKAHASMLAVMDAKHQNEPEWLAFKAIDEALRDFVEATAPAPKRLPLRKMLRPKHLTDSDVTYSGLAGKALTAAGEPVTTKKMVEFVGQHRKLTADPAKAKINVVSALSHDDKFQSVEWQGGRAWWWAGKPVPSPKPQGQTSLNDGWHLTTA